MWVWKGHNPKIWVHFLRGVCVAAAAGYGLKAAFEDSVAFIPVCGTEEFAHPGVVFWVLSEVLDHQKCSINGMDDAICKNVPG